MISLSCGTAGQDSELRGLRLSGAGQCEQCLSLPYRTRSLIPPFMQPQVLLIDLLSSLDRLSLLIA